MEAFTLRMAIAGDVPEIMEIMASAHRAMADPSAYILDDADYVSAHLSHDGFTLVAEADGRMAGFFLVCVPGLAENNLGRYLDFSERQLRGVAMMDSSAVRPEYQGRGLMGRMFSEAAGRCEKTYPYLLGTVAPENLPSRRNFEKCGFAWLKTVIKPGGQERLLMGKFSGAEPFRQSDR